VQLKELTGNLAASAGVEVKPFNLQNLLSDLEIDYAPSNKAALSSVSFSANVKGGLDSAKLTGIALNLDESQLRGSQMGYLLPTIYRQAGLKFVTLI